METTKIRMCKTDVDPINVDALQTFSIGEPTLVPNKNNPRWNKLEFTIVNNEWVDAERLLKQHDIRFEILT